jgi:hypothetical protein
MGNGSFLPPSKWDDFFKCGYPGKIMNHEMEGSLLSEKAYVLMDVEQMNSSRLPGVKPAMEKRSIHPTCGCHWKWGDKPLPVRIYHSNLQLVVSPWNFWLVMCVWPKGHILWFQWEFWAEKSTTCEHWKSFGRKFMIPMVPSITTCLGVFLQSVFWGLHSKSFLCHQCELWGNHARNSEDCYLESILGRRFLDADGCSYQCGDPHQNGISQDINIVNSLKWGSLPIHQTSEKKYYQLSIVKKGDLRDWWFMVVHRPATWLY